MSGNRQLPAAAARWADKDRVDVVEHQWETGSLRRGVEALVLKMTAGVPKGSILDLGCGTARYSETLTGWHTYVGVDESAPMIVLAGERLGRVAAEGKGLVTALVRSDVRLWQPAAPDVFDLALCLEVAPHYADPLGFIADVVARHRSRRFLVSVEAHEKPEGGDRDFLVGTELGSRSVARADMERFFARYDVVALERVASAWHPDAVDWFCLLKGNAR